MNSPFRIVCPPSSMSSAHGRFVVERAHQVIDEVIGRFASAARHLAV